MPIIFHLGDKGGDYGIVDELGLPGLERALKAFPKLLFFGHSQKFWAEIGQCDASNRGSYPSGKVVPGRLVELFRRYPNLRGDLSAGSGCNAILRDPEFGYAFLEEFSDRLYFGTDICQPWDDVTWIGRLSRFLDDAVINGKISYETYERVSRGNALDLLEKYRNNPARSASYSQRSGRKASDIAMMGFGFGIFPVMFTVVFLIITVGVICVFVSALRGWHKNIQSPRLTVEARVVSRRTSHIHTHHADGMPHTHTYYHATFEVASGDRMELTLSGEDYGMLAEDDVGDLTFQGTRFLDFQRKY